jgi:hypothetical protein
MDANGKDIDGPQSRTDDERSSDHERRIALKARDQLLVAAIAARIARDIRSPRSSREDLQ